MKRTAWYWLALGIVLSLLTLESRAAICYFGYATTPPADLAAISSSVHTSSGYYVVASATENVVTTVSQINTAIGPVILNLENLIWNPNQVTGVDCRHYERGTTGTTTSNYLLRGAYASNLQTFLDANSSVFQGGNKVRGIVVSSEANNRCIENWKLNTAATTLANWFTSHPTLVRPPFIVGYGLTNTYINGVPTIVSKGLPVDTNGNIAKFPSGINLIAYWSYDIWDPSNAAHPNNLNGETWATISNKLNLALQPGQQTLGVLQAFCTRAGGAVETAWGIGCPNMAVWKLGVVADNWRNYWLADSRNVGVIAFAWQDTPEFYGTRSMSPIWPNHSAINDMRNCMMLTDPAGHEPVK
ncbi:MAG: hypothetical protein U0002_14345 [Thermoanaerobaculia bacterium]